MAGMDDPRSTVDPYGFERPEKFDYKQHEDFMAQYLSVLARRRGKWDQVASTKNGAPVIKSGKLKRYVRKGIPSVLRAQIWMEVSGAEQRRRSNPGLYDRMRAGPHSKELIELIVTDLHRTFPDNIYFQRDTSADPEAKTQSLYNVLIAFGQKNQQIGYCQGLNFIAGMLLIIVKNEEKVFWLMDTLVNNILPDYKSLNPTQVACDEGRIQRRVVRNPSHMENHTKILYQSCCAKLKIINPYYYSKDMLGVQTDQEVIGELVKERMPDVTRLLDACGVAWALISTKWFICLFCDVLPIETVLRIWDCLFYEGSKVIFRVAITVVKHNRARILDCRSFPEVVNLFKEFMSDKFATNCHQFIQAIFTEPGTFSRSHLERLRQQCQQRVLNNK